MRIARRLAPLTALVAAGSLLVAGCGDDEATAGSDTAAGPELSGRITADGSSTVGPLTAAAAEAFNAEHPDVDITVATSGTGGGFEVFCQGETDISNASREIEPEEAAVCEENGVAYTQFRVASDGITLVTSQTGADVGDDDLTLEQLEAIWEQGSTITNWSEIPGGDFNDVPLTLAGPGSQSGTYDFFNEVVLGEDASGETRIPRQDYAASEDDNVTVRAVTGAPGGLGYFGYSYFSENQDLLKAFTIEGVLPTPETISNDTYPLSRPLYVYVANEALQRPEVEAFVRFYLENAVTLAEGNAFVPAPQASLAEQLAELDAVTSG